MTNPLGDLFGGLFGSGSTPVAPGGTYWWAAAFVSELTGIPSGEAFGTPSLGKIVGVEGIASGEEFGSTVLTYNQDIAFTSIDEGVLGEPVVSHAENQIVRADGIPSAEAFGTPELICGWLLEPSGIASAEAFGLTAIPSPPRFDAVGAGTTNNTFFETSFSWSHSGSASAYVIADIVLDRPPESGMAVTYGGVAMTKLVEVALGNVSNFGPGHFYRYGLANIPGGTKTIAVTNVGNSQNFAANSASYLGVSSISSADATTVATGASLSQSTTTTSAQLAVQAFGGNNSNALTAFTSPSGGTNRFNGGGGQAQLSISESAAASPTFTASAYHDPGNGQTQYWIGCIHKLLASIPVLEVPSITSGETFGDVTVIRAAPQTLEPSAIASAEAFGTAMMGPTQSIAPSGVASGEAVGTATTGLFIIPTGIASAGAFGTSTVAAAGVSFDAANTGAVNSGGTTLSWTHTNVVTADVFVSVVTSSNVTISSITCGGTAMTLVTSGSKNNNNTAASGATRLYRLAGVSAGGKTISITASGSTALAGSSVSYSGVASVATASSTSGTGFSLTQSATCTAGQWILQTFGASSPSFFGLSSPSGGTNRTNNSTGNTFARCMISDATANATFTAASSDFSTAYAGVAVVLS